MRWGGGGERVVVLAFAAFDASAVGVADVGFLADASGSAAAFQASFRHLGIAVDQERQRGAAAGQAVQLLTAFAVDFAVAGALTLRLSGLGEQRLRGGAVGGDDANAVFVPQVSFLAEASDDAVAGADRAGMRVGAGGRASGTARVEDFVLRALVEWGQHHERGRRDRVDFRALFGQDASAVGSRAEVTFLAGATGDADARAERVGFIASAIAALALTEFFVIAAHFWWQRHGFGGRNAAALGRHADSVFVFQVAGFAEASDHALQRADRAGVRVGAGRGAGRSAGHENFVFFALRDLRRVGEEHVGFRGIALLGWHAKTTRVSQMSLLTEASDDAVLGTDRAGMRIGAGRSTSRATSLEFFIVWALRELFRKRRSGESDAENGNAEQQRESKARVHR